jgi:predicted neutral ceramidase superfamily lipid hydrolase
MEKVETGQHILEQHMPAAVVEPHIQVAQRQEVPVAVAPDLIIILLMLLMALQILAVVVVVVETAHLQQLALVVLEL